jgi:hypothetical protein
MTDATDLFAIVPVAHRPPEEAIVVGPLKEVFEYIPQSIARADAEGRLDEGMARAAKTEELQAMTRCCNLLAFADALNHIGQRLDAYEARRQERARRDAARAAEEERKAIQDKLDALPDPDDPAAFDPPPNEPGGELHTLGPSEVPASDQTEFPAPEDPSAAPGGTVFPQPTTIELDHEHDPRAVTPSSS